MDLGRKLQRANAIISSLENSNKLLNKELANLRHELAKAEADLADARIQIRTLRKKTTVKKEQDDNTTAPE